MTTTFIGDALFTKTQQKVLGLLFSMPDQSFYSSEIMRIAGMGRGTISRELYRLVNSGLLTMRKVGNQCHYQANSDSPIFTEMRSIAIKTFGISEQIKRALMVLDANIEIAFVYGSMAKRTNTSSSDVDLMLIGKDLSYGVVMEFLLPLEDALQRTINPTLYTIEDFTVKLNAHSSFISRVLEQTKIFIKGTDNDIRELSQNKSAKERSS